MDPLYAMQKYRDFTSQDSSGIPGNFHTLDATWCVGIAWIGTTNLLIAVTESQMVYATSAW